MIKEEDAEGHEGFGKRESRLMARFKSWRIYNWVEWMIKEGDAEGHEGFGKREWRLVARFKSWKIHNWVSVYTQCFI